MPLPLKPHTMTVTKYTTATVSSEVTSYPAVVPDVTIDGQITESSPVAVLEEYGIDLQFPAVWLCDLEDADDLQVGFKGVVNGRTYRVVSGPQRNDAVPAISHARYLLERESD